MSGIVGTVVGKIYQHPRTITVPMVFGKCVVDVPVDDIREQWLLEVKVGYEESRFVEVTEQVFDGVGVGFEFEVFDA